MTPLCLSTVEAMDEWIHADLNVQRSLTLEMRLLPGPNLPEKEVVMFLVRLTLHARDMCIQFPDLGNSSMCRMFSDPTTRSGAGVRTRLDPGQWYRSGVCFVFSIAWRWVAELLPITPPHRDRSLLAAWPADGLSGGTPWLPPSPYATPNYTNDTHDAVFGYGAKSLRDYLQGYSPSSYFSDDGGLSAGWLVKVRKARWANIGTSIYIGVYFAVYCRYDH